MKKGLDETRHRAIMCAPLSETLRCGFSCQR